MNELEFILFNVGHGLSATLIEHPERYVTVVDLGSEGHFSPLKYLADTRRLRADVLYITHPHGDHISDIETVYSSSCCPNYVFYQDYDWDDVINRERKELRDKVRKYVRFITAISKGLYAGSASLSYWRWTPKNAVEAFGENRYINNSSLFLIYKWKDFKIAIAGDHETDAMERLCGHSEFVEQTKGADILVAPHHGHKQGYTSLWPQEIGKPYVTLVSVQSRDPNVASDYQSQDFAKGVEIGGEKRYCLTTRSEGNISIRMWYNAVGEPKWRFDTGW